MNEQKESKRKSTPRPEPSPTQPIMNHSGWPYIVQIIFMAAVVIAFLLEVILNDGTR